MWRIEKRIDIDLAPERVFDYLSHFHFIREWDPGVLDARMIRPGNPAEGSRFRVQLLFGWKRIPMDYEIISMTPPRELVLEGRAAGFEALDRILLESRGSGTRLSYFADVVFRRPPEPIAERAMRLLFNWDAHRAIHRLRIVLSGSKRTPGLTALTRMADQAILPGLFGFTRAGYRLGRNRRPVAAALYAGRTVVLTGGTSGIGKAAARELHAKGARLVVVGRDGGKLARLREELSPGPGRMALETETADLSLMSETRSVAARLTRRCGKIDVLINNAGALFNRYQRTDEGNEKTLATDLLGPYLLTRLLLPALQAASDARIINVASGGMYTQPIRPDDMQSSPDAYDGAVAYARAKRALVVLTAMWARQLAPRGISVHAMHPGWVDTPGLVRSLPAFHRQLAPWLRTPAQGADTIVWLAAAPDAARASGHFWLDRKIRATHVFPHTRERAAERAALVRALDELAGLEPL